MTRTTVHRACTLCEATCGIRVTTEDRRVLRIEGDPDDPFSRGHVCPKAVALGEIQHDPDRLRTPVRRTADGFVPIGWEEALDLAAARLSEIREAAGNDAIALYRGNPTVHDAQSLLYWNVLQRAIPTRSQFSAGSLDTWPRWVQAGLMYGGFLHTPVPDLERCEYLLILGANPVVSNGSLMTAPGIKTRLRELRARGGTLVVVDPRRSETAELADLHLAIRPGGDAAFVLALVHVLFAEDRVDLGACRDLVNDLPRVRELVSCYSPERVAPVCGIPSDVIRRVAHDFASARAAAAYGRMGASVQRFGTLAHWAIDLLNILTGNLDREGGLLFPKPAASLAFVGPKPGEDVELGRRRSPVGGYDEILGEWPMAAFAEEIESTRDDRIRALVVIAGNPVLSAPNAARTAAALERLEFMLAFDYYVNESTRHADLIIPPTAVLENENYDVALLHFAVENVAKWSPAALPVEPGMRPIWKSLLGLAKRLLGLAALPDEQVDGFVVRQLIPALLERSPFAGKLEVEAIEAQLGDRPGPRRLLDLLLRLGPHGDGFGLVPGGLDLATVERAPHGLSLGRLEPSLPGSLKTASGRIELAPARIVDDLPRLDAWLAAERANGSTESNAANAAGRGANGADGGASAEEPLSLIGRRDVRSMNSWLHNLPALSKGRDRCTLEVAPVDAERLGLRDGGRARVESRIASLVVPVEVSDRMRPGVVSLTHGFGHDLPGAQLSVAAKRPGVNANLLVDDAEVDRPSGTSVLSGVSVRVTPA